MKCILVFALILGLTWSVQSLSDEELYSTNHRESQFCMNQTQATAESVTEALITKESEIVDGKTACYAICMLNQLRKLYYAKLKFPIHKHKFTVPNNTQLTLDVDNKYAVLKYLKKCFDHVIMLNEN